MQNRSLWGNRKREIDLAKIVYSVGISLLVWSYAVLGLAGTAVLTVCVFKWLAN